MSILLQLKSAATAMFGPTFRSSLIADMTAIEGSVNELQANVISLQSSGSVPVWSSDGTYAVGAIAYSPTSFHNYRNKTGAVGTDPAGDATNWQMVEFSANAVDVNFTPAGAVASTNLQDAVEEVDAAKAAKTEIQDGSLDSFTATLTGTEYSATPSPAITAYAANQRFNMVFASACPDAPTLKLNGIATPPSLVRQNLNGSYETLNTNDFPAGWQSPVKLISATQALVLVLPRITKILTGLTRNLATASGNVAYTGCGATPKFIRLVGSDGTIQSMGSGKVGTESCLSNLVTINSFLGRFQVSGGNYQIVNISAFAKDSITLTWTKTGSPTGTVTFYLEVEY